MIDIDQKPSSYMDYLPAIYREDEIKGEANFIGRFLKIFEKILSGIDDGVKLEGEREITGIEEVIEIIHDYFDPLFTRGPTVEEAELPDFVSYLASWLSLSIAQNWDEKTLRRLIRNIVPLYKKRGTKEGLSEYLIIFVGPNVYIDESLQGFVIGQTGTIGVDTFVGGLLPHFFIVTTAFLEIISLGFIQETIKATKSIIDLEKPAHTYYALRFNFPGIYVGIKEYSTVGKNTIIGRNYPVFV